MVSIVGTSCRCRDPFVDRTLRQRHLKSVMSLQRVQRLQFILPRMIPSVDGRWRSLTAAQRS